MSVLHPAAAPASDLAPAGVGFRLARGVAEMGQSRLRDLMSRTARPGVLSFAVGLPATDRFPVRALWESAGRLWPGEPASLQYAVPYAPLKSQIVELMAARGVRCRPEQIFLTSGA